MLYNVIGCLLLSRRCNAVDNGQTLPLNKMAAFTIPNCSHCQKRPRKCAAFQLQAQLTKQTNPLLELKTVHVQDFDDRDALASAGGDGDDYDRKDATDEDVNGNIAKKIIRPPIENKAPRSFPRSPPHTALAQVLANQYGIDLASVSPSAKGPSRKITAEDVEYHAWKVSQPPCTDEALELAHSLDLDLNYICDDEDEEYVLQLRDVELFLENEISLKMVSHTRKGMDYENTTQSARKRMNKINSLDKRMERNVVKLSQKAFALAGSVTGGILGRVQSQTLKAGEKLREAGVFLDANGADDINSVGDFDSDLASEIQEALSCVNFDDDNAVDPSSSSADVNSEMARDVNAVGDFDATLASEIQEALSCANVEDGHAVESTSSSTKEELQSMTVLQLKNQLRGLGMKVSGNKAELVDRLFDANDVNDRNEENTNEGNGEMKKCGRKAVELHELDANDVDDKNTDNTNDDKSESPLFFAYAAPQGSGDK